MDISPKLLRIALAFTLVCASLSGLILSVKYNPAQAQATETRSAHIPVGIIQHDLQKEGTPGFLIHIIGYSQDPLEAGRIKVLAKEWVKR